MKLINEPKTIETWITKCTCNRCDADLQVTAQDVDVVYSTNWAMKRPDIGFVVVCSQCEHAIKIDPPYFVQESLKKVRGTQAEAKYRESL